MSNIPVVDFISLGPGDPELLTARAVSSLRQADVVLLPATRDADGRLHSRARDIIGDWCPAERQRTYVLPMSHDRQAARQVYAQLRQDISQLYQEGRRVAVVVEGDVSIYASIHYVLEDLQADGIPVVQTPGIPSFIAAAAMAGLSLVSQQQRLLVLPGQTTGEELQRLLDTNHVVVVMKLSQCQQEVKDFLRQSPSVTCHYFEQVGTADAFHSADRSVVMERQMPYFSLCILYPG